MRVVIPAAGQGTRLYPQTHTKPKPMVRVAGQPVLGHILADLVQSPVDEVVVVVGVMQEMVVEYVTEKFGNVLEVSFVEQEQTEGLGHAIYQARDRVAGDSLSILLGDMLFDSDYDRFVRAHESLDGVDGSIGVKAVDDPSNYGIAAVEDGRIAGLEEKPADPDSDLAVSGVYFIEDSEWLFETIETLVENDVRGAGGEYQLTDALQRMIEQDADFGTLSVEGWYDCGQPETLLEANRVLLERRETNDQVAEIHGGTSVVLPPADIGEGVTLEESVVGPYVSLNEGATVVESHLKNAIVGRESTLRRVNLAGSLIGDGATVTGSPYELNVGDSSDVQW